MFESLMGKIKNKINKSDKSNKKKSTSGSPQKTNSKNDLKNDPKNDPKNDLKNDPKNDLKNDPKITQEMTQEMTTKIQLSSPIQIIVSKENTTEYTDGTGITYIDDHSNNLSDSDSKDSFQMSDGTFVLSDDIFFNDDDDGDNNNNNNNNNRDNHQNEYELDMDEQRILVKNEKYKNHANWINKMNDDMNVKYNDRVIMLKLMLYELNRIQGIQHKQKIMEFSQDVFSYGNTQTIHKIISGFIHEEYIKSYQTLSI